MRLIDFACVCFESEGGLHSQNDEAEPGYGTHLWSQPRGGGGRAEGEQRVPDPKELRGKRRCVGP